jgi:gamma-carbonic anhydrase
LFHTLDNWHRSFVYFDKINPETQIGMGVFVAPNATVIGKVEICSDSSVWYGCVLRGDLNTIKIGTGTNIQDGTVITTDDKVTIGGFNSEVIIGNYTTIGHGVRLHACQIGNECIIGMGATILEGAIVEDGAVVGAGSIVPPGRVIPKMEVFKFVKQSYGQDHQQSLKEM